MLLSLTFLVIPTMFAISQTSNWQLSGNSNVNAATDFVGTTNSIPLIFKTNNIERMRIDADGNIGSNNFNVNNNNVHFTSGDYFGSFTVKSNVVSFTGNDYYGKFIVFDNTTSYPQSHSGLRFAINGTTHSQIFFNGGAFSHGTSIDGLTGNTEVLSREGDVYLSTGTFLSNGLIVKNGTGYIGVGTNTPLVKLDVNGTTYSRKMFIGTPDANTTSNMGSNNLLAVKGTAVFVKAKVAIYGSGWPDYVFETGYPLPTLDSLDRFIKDHKRLPEMPSAKEVEQDGLDLGATQALLLKKIEELTLIIIQQEKRIDLLEKQIIR